MLPLSLDMETQSVDEDQDRGFLRGGDHILETARRDGRGLSHRNLVEIQQGLEIGPLDSIVDVLGYGAGDLDCTEAKGSNDDSDQVPVLIQ